MSVCPSARLSVCRSARNNGFCWNMVSEIFSKFCRGNSFFIKIRREQRVLYTKTFFILWQYLAKFLLEWEMFQIKFVEKIKIYIFWGVTFFFFENHVLYDKIFKDIVKALGLVACWIIKATSAQAKARTRTPPPTHPCTPLTHTHTHTEIYNIFCFSVATIFRKIASVLRYTYTACLA
jgi:hypothetical protein